MSEHAQAVVSVTGAHKALPTGAPVLADLDLEANASESLALIGRSGSGKSTLLSILGLMDRFDTGGYALNGVSVPELSVARTDALRGAQVGFVFQRFTLVPHLSVLENVIVPLRHASRRNRRAMTERGMASLASVGLDAAATKRPRQLSGGEQQRVAVARALIRDPGLLLADEPTGSLDAATGSSVIDIMLRLVADTGTCLILVTHDPQVAARMDRSLELRDGRLHPVENGAVAAGGRER